LYTVKQEITRWDIVLLWNVYFVTKTGLMVKGNSKVFPYSLPSIGPEADPGVQTVSPQVTLSYPPGGRLPLLSARPAATSVAFTDGANRTR